jgi:hypothetical protein
MNPRLVYAMMLACLITACDRRGSSSSGEATPARPSVAVVPESSGPMSVDRMTLRPIRSLRCRTPLNNSTASVTNARPNSSSCRIR